MAAVACAVAILVAGGTFLVRTLSNKDQLTVKNATIGETRTVQGVTAEVVSWRRISGQIQAVVRMSVPAGTTGPDPAAQPWVLQVGTPQTALEPIGLSPSDVACRQASLAVVTSTTCVLAFSDAKGTPYLALALGGAQAQWLLAT